MEGITRILQIARGYLGVQQYSVAHHALVEAYNQVSPLPVGYAVQVSDDWCDVFVTVCGDLAQASAYIGRECGVARHVQWFKAQGIWLGRTLPQAGDIVVFDYGTGYDHIGWVEYADDERIQTIEGNYNAQVARGYYALDDMRIAGYARPEYEAFDWLEARAIAETTNQEATSLTTLVKEIWQGQWGNGQERIQRLRQAGYDPVRVQAAVNAGLGQSESEVGSDQSSSAPIAGC